MKKIFSLFIISAFTLSSAIGQTDTMYVMRQGDVIGKFHVSTQMDSLIFYAPEPLNSPTYVTKVPIPAGTFTMGSPASEPNRNADEIQHTVTLNKFWMSRYEITNAQFANFLNKKSIGQNGLYAAGQYPTQPLVYENFSSGVYYSTSSLIWIPAPGCDNQPVVSVTWYGASEFANFAGGNLPTEAQWEYACRANTTTPFNTGNCLDWSQANYNWSSPYGTCTNTQTASYGKTLTVGHSARNAFGLYDIHGNVLEWCADWYGAYPADAQTDPTGATSGTKKVYRGGAYTSSAKYCRSAWRGSQTPNFYHTSVGFRVAFPDVPKTPNYDTLYVMKQGAAIARLNIHNQVDSVIFYKSNQESVSRFPGALTTDSTISIFTQALFLTHLSDSLRKVEDLAYKPYKVFLDEYNKYQIINPQTRKYGYTVLIESNDLLKANGINNLQDLIAQAKALYPGCEAYDNDFTNRKNSLNKYIAYHLINKAIYSNKWFYTRSAVAGYVPDEFIETMLPNRLIRASYINNQVTLNPNSDYTAHVSDGSSKTFVNGVYHLLDKMLVYTETTTNSVENTLQNTRIRFDVTSLFPEMANNNIRASEGVMKVNNSSGDRYGFEQGYLSGITFSKDTWLIYLASKDKQWANFQADELIALGPYDVTLRLPPVPPGTYEIRYGYTANNNRSITEFSVDNVPMSMPVDLRIQTSDPSIGSLLDVITNDNGYENDKLLRNHGYMKAPNISYYGTTLLRDYLPAIRRIVGTFTFTDYKPHAIRFRSMMSNPNSQLILDYLEYAPVNVYDNPSGEPESRD